MKRKLFKGAHSGAKWFRDCAHSRKHQCTLMGTFMLIVGTFMAVFIGIHGAGAVIEILGLFLIMAAD